MEVSGKTEFNIDDVVYFYSNMNNYTVQTTQGIIKRVKLSFIITKEKIVSKEETLCIEYSIEGFKGLQTCTKDSIDLYKNKEDLEKELVKTYLNNLKYILYK